jgi:arylsulfatase A-like enzyme
LSDKPRMLYGDNRPDRATARTKVYGKMARSLLSADELVEQVDRTMRGLDERSNTLAFYVSDNGFALGEHGLLGKKKPYPIASRVPLYMRWPRGPVERGGRDRRLVANIDILPTVLEAAGLSPVNGHTIDGRSLQSTQARSRMLVEAFASSGAHSWASLITDNVQYTQYYDENETVEFREYYDRVNDTWYLTNTLGDGDPLNDPSPLTVQLLENQLENDRECAGSSCP